MSPDLPSIIVSGASGVVGRHFIAAARERFRIFALARRSQREVEVPEHANLTWIQVDVADWEALKAVVRKVRALGPVDFVLHLAAYYDFSNTDHPEYLRTNVNGTIHLLEQAKWLSVRRFIFTSSIAACRVPAPGSRITEDSPADAVFPYARSKQHGEELVREYSRFFPCTVLRLAAVFSDWCEYPPLYMFLSTWLSRRWNARILAGSGTSAVPYLHVNDLNRLLLGLLATSDRLPGYSLYLASPDGATSHRRLYEAATRVHLGRARRPILLPRSVVAPGIVARDLVGRLIGRRPFERAWMIRYIDRRLEVDGTRTRHALGWQPSPRLDITRRCLVMVERMKSEPHIWHRTNEAVLRRVADRPGLRIGNALSERRLEVIGAVLAALRAGAEGLDRYRTTPESELEWSLGLAFRLLSAAVRSGDRTLLLSYLSDAAERRYGEGFTAADMGALLLLAERTVVEALLSAPELAGLEIAIRDTVSLTFALAREEVEDRFEELVTRASPGADFEVSVPRPAASRVELERLVTQLEAFSAYGARESALDVDTDPP